MKSILMSILIMLFCSCTSESKTIEKEINEPKLDEVNLDYDSIQFVFYGNEVLESTKELKVAYDFFTQVNSISNWDSITNREVIAAEGGNLSLYYLDGLKKITKEELGETYNTEMVYYCTPSVMLFIYERTIKFNRPIYWDSITMIEQGDDEVFDISKFDTVYCRYYFNAESEELIKINHSANYSNYFDSTHINEDLDELKMLISPFFSH